VETRAGSPAKPKKALNPWFRRGPNEKGEQGIWKSKKKKMTEEQVKTQTRLNKIGGGCLKDDIPAERRKKGGSCHSCQNWVHQPSLSQVDKRGVAGRRVGSRNDK